MEEKRSKTSDILSIYVPAFFIFLGMGLVSPLLPIYARSFNVSFALVSLAISIYAVGRLFADIPSGFVADRIGRKPLMIAGTILLAGMSFMSVAVTDFWLFLLSRLMQGVGSAMWITGRQTLLTDILKPSERGRILGYFQTFQLIGSATGPVVGGFVSEIWNIQAPFYFYALLGVISLILTLFMVHETKIVKDKHEGDRHFSPQIIKRIIRNRTFCMACLATFSIILLTTGIRQMMIPLYADYALKLGNIEIGTVISYITIMNLVMTVPMGYMIDYYGRKSVILKSLFIAAIACVLFAFTYDYLSLSLVAVLLGLGTSGSQQAPLAMATDVTINEPHGISIALYRLFGDIGFIIGPILMGAIADNYHDLKMPFYFMAALLFVNAALLLLFAKETYRQKQNKDKGNETSKMKS